MVYGNLQVMQVPNMRTSNAYFVTTEHDRLILIDTGTSSGFARIVSYIRSIGRKLDDIETIVLTHADPDHSGSAAALRRVTGAKVAIHELDAPRIEGKKRLKEVNSSLGNIMFGIFGKFMRFERFEPDIILKGGDSVGPLSVIHTPGHTEGSVCLYLPSIALFSGDTLRTTKQIPEIPPGFINSNTKLLKQSLNNLFPLEFEQLYPGHGEPILKGAATLVRKIGNTSPIDY